MGNYLSESALREQEELAKKSGYSSAAELAIAYANDPQEV